MTAQISVWTTSYINWGWRVQPNLTRSQSNPIVNAVANQPETDRGWIFYLATGFDFYCSISLLCDRMDWFGKTLVVLPVGNQSSASWNETKGIIRFTPIAEDRGKRLTCRAKNANLSRITENAIEVSGHSPAGTYSAEHHKEDSRHLVIHGKSNRSSTTSGFFICSEPLALLAWFGKFISDTYDNF